MSTLIERLQRKFIYVKLHGDDPGDTHVAPIEIERDKRSQKKAVKAALEEGLITSQDGTGESLRMTSLAYTMLKATKPDLVTKTFAVLERYGESRRVHANDIAKCMGVEWAALTLEEQKWIVEHPGEYQAFYYNPHWGPPVPPARKVLIGDRATFQSAQHGYQEQLHVSDAGVEAERKRRIFKNRFDDIKRQNLVWGLVKAGLLDEADKDLIRHRDDHDLLVGNEGFGDDPEKWPDEMQQRVVQLQEKAEKCKTNADKLVTLLMKVALFGGWEKFFEEYDAMILAEMERRENDDA